MGILNLVATPSPKVMRSLFFAETKALRFDDLPSVIKLPPALIVGNASKSRASAIRPSNVKPTAEN